MKNTARKRLQNAFARPESDANREREIKWAIASESHYRIDAALELAKSEPPIRDKTQSATYLAPRLTKTVLRDFRTMDAASLLADIHRSHGLSRSTRRHLKAFMSTVFTFAKNQGVLDGVNPIQDAMIPRRAATPGETHASTPDEVLSMMQALEKAGEQKACAAVALMFFAGLGLERLAVPDGKTLMASG